MALLLYMSLMGLPIFVAVLPGTPLMEVNDIAVLPEKREVIFGDGVVNSYGSPHLASVGSASRHAIALPSDVHKCLAWRVSGG